ncbi:hypothetical protein TYRP_008065 [Tyrophagus putrescentiae]|nr:hypothetical protein TYRP_008065 [Tyrophagus putrescentiae]
MIVGPCRAADSCPPPLSVQSHDFFLFLSGDYVPVHGLYFCAPDYGHGEIFPGLYAPVPALFLVRARVLDPVLFPARVLGRGLFPDPDFFQGFDDCGLDLWIVP